MHLASLTVLLVTQAVLNSSAAAAGFVQEQQSRPTPDIDVASVVRACDATGPVTINFHYPPSPPSIAVDPSHGRIYGLLITAIITVISLFVYKFWRVFLGWLPKHNSTHSPASSARSGRTAAVASATPPEPKTISPAEQQALSLNEEVARDIVRHSRTTSLVAVQESAELGRLTVSSALEHPASPESDFLPDISPSIEAASLVLSRGPCGYHRGGYGVVQAKELVKRPKTSVDKRPRGIQHVLAEGSLLENTRLTAQNEDEVLRSPESSVNQRASGSRASLTKSITGLAVAPPIVALSILSVWLNWSHSNDPDFPHLPGVTHDLRYFKRICSGLEAFITLNTLTDATYDIMYAKILETFENKRQGTAVILHFNGHGEGDSFLLYDYSYVNATIVTKWITAIREETRNYLPVTVIFDHCRFDSPRQSYLDLGEGIHIIYAAMPGQRSADFQMADDDDAYIPCSNFLKACCLALAEARTRPIVPVDDFMSRMNFWMKKVVRMMRVEECRMNKCRRPCRVCRCLSYDRCVHRVTRARHGIAEAYPRVQNANGVFTGFENGVCMSELLERIEPTLKPFLDRIQETAERIKSHRVYRPINKVAEPSGEGNQFKPIDSRVRRGGSAGVVARPA